MILMKICTNTLTHPSLVVHLYAQHMRHYKSNNLYGRLKQVS